MEFVVNASKSKKVTNKCRDWRNYSKDLLNVKLASVDWNVDIDDVQQYWNEFEN